VPSVEPIDNRRRCRAEDPISDLSRLTINLPMQGVCPEGSCERCVEMTIHSKGIFST
jgi:hypothetical protein